jgi:hypothetical protein
VGLDVYKLHNPQIFQVDGSVRASAAFSTNLNELFLRVSPRFDASMQLAWIEPAAALVVAPDRLLQLVDELSQMQTLLRDLPLADDRLRGQLSEELEAFSRFVQEAMAADDFISIDAEPVR